GLEDQTQYKEAGCNGVMRPRRLPVKPQWSSEARQDLKEDTGKSSLATKDGLLFPCKTLLHGAVMDVVELAWLFILLAMEGNQQHTKNQQVKSHWEKVME
ncbi:unnamed protein product, partial [Musa acuminata subsp. burmannicoides]